MVGVAVGVEPPPPPPPQAVMKNNAKPDADCTSFLIRFDPWMLHSRTTIWRNIGYAKLHAVLVVVLQKNAKAFAGLDPRRPRVHGLAP